MTGVTPQKLQPKVDFWRAFGHSWLQYQTGPSGDQTGRVDALFRSAMDVEYNSWRNYANSGGRICGGGRSLGGWTKIVQRVQPPAGRLYPYAPDGGGTLICFGINDMAAYGGHLTNVRATMVHTHRAVISYLRASRRYETTDARFAYGAGWTSNASGLDLGMGTVDRLCSTTTAATITMTLPADYQGEIVALAFLNNMDTTGVTITWSGTALSGNPANGTTFNTGQGLPAAMATFGYMVKRFTGLTSANAGQTIIGTCTARDGGTGSGFFDGGWLESKTPAPVIVCNVARPTAAGYTALNAFFTTWTGQGTESSRDGDVQSYNAALLAMTQEFDAMVQVADVDSIVGKDALSFSDGIHPNELGAGEIVDAMLGAITRLSAPVSASSYSIGFNPPSPRVAARRKPRVLNNWYTAEYQAASATYTPVAGHFYAIPIEITESRDQYNQLAMETSTAGTVSGTIRWGIYEDVNWDGYPGELLAGMDISSGAAFTITVATGVKVSATFTTPFVPDPGLYWLAMKVDTTGTGQVYRGLTGSNHLMPNVTTTGLPVAGGYMGWRVTGAATGVLPGSFPTGAAVQGTVPYVGIKKSK
jgi:lysophospholipase L1-like esterase